MSVSPPVWSALELDVFRGGLALAVLWSFDGLHRAQRADDLSFPEGWARLVPLAWAGQPRVRRTLPVVVWVAVVAHLLDRASVVALGVLAAVLIVEVTRDNSSGGGGHRHHLVATVCVVQFAGALAWTGADVAGWASNDVLLADRQATMTWWSVQAIVAVYFVSGLEKLLATGGRWVHRSPGLLVRAKSVQTANAMRPSQRKRAAAARAQTLIDRLAGHPGLARVLFGAGLLAELVAPVGLVHQDLLVVVGLALLCLHWANGMLLGLPFVQWQLLVVVFLVNPARLFG